ncbi:MAG: hypothetical protein GF349_02845 [Candidatus Magasanikbacteria bacterium]|nr:hypothetical protein [Candidatus Magasanikbacteria bacterium]
MSDELNGNLFDERGKKRSDSQKLDYSKASEKIKQLPKEPSRSGFEYKNITESKLAKPKQESIAAVLDDKRKDLENQAFAQDIKLKRQTLQLLFIFLGCETIAIFAYTFFQGVEVWGFKLEQWSFNLLVSATITQITVMLIIAVKHLFPQKD